MDPNALPTPAIALHDLTRFAGLESWIAALEPVTARLEARNTYVYPLHVRDEDIVIPEPSPEHVFLDEHLIGAEFIICQGAITGIVSRALRLAHACTAAQNTTLSKWENRDYLFEIASDPLPGTSLSKVAAINHVANYFKHRDEWPSDWSKLKGLARGTAAAVLACGLIPHCPYNLRIARRNLGGTILPHVMAWADELLALANRLLVPPPSPASLV